jgi:hypothetical protein
MKSNEILTNFNNVLLQFLSELDRLFPDSKAKTYHKTIKMSFFVDKSLWIKYFTEGTKNHCSQIMTKDEHYFLTQEITFVRKLDLKKYYKNSNYETKNSMWQYMQTLFLLSCSYNNYTPEFLKSVYKVAQETGNSDTSTDKIISTIEKLKK